MSDTKSAGRTILITGATGQQGGAIASELLTRGHRVRAFTRDASTPAASALAAKGAQIVVGSFDQPASLEAAARGADAAFLMSTPYVAGTSTETTEGLAAAAALDRAGVPHVVFSSVAQADQHTGIPHFESKLPVEAVVRARQGTWAILAPVFFMENWASPWWLPGLQQGTLAVAMPEHRVLQQVALADLGVLGALALTEPARFAGRRIDIASDEVSPGQVMATIARLSGRTLTYAHTPIEQVRAWSEDTALMMEWFDRVGYSADRAALRQEFPEVQWHSFESWAASRDWSALLAQPAAR